MANNGLIAAGTERTHKWPGLTRIRTVAGSIVECSVFLFEKRCAEKLHKPKRKETVTEILRTSVKQLERYRHPKILQVLHSIEECSETLAFATEQVYASLANVLFHQQEVTSIHGGAPLNSGVPQSPKPTHAREYKFLDIEYKYGLLQITEALSFLHYTGHQLHRNVCPASILITKKGTWKLAGLEFIERVSDIDGVEPVPCQPWTSRQSKMAQPYLDYTAPETQISSVSSILSDMFSLGMVICAIFNNGRPLIQAGNSSSAYLKQLELLEDQVKNILLPRVPVPLQEATSRLLSRDTRQRPTAQLLILIKYFSDPAVNALQFLDVITMKDPTQKTHFYRMTLKEALPYIPKKLWFQHVWPSLQQEMKSQEVQAAVLQAALFMIRECTIEEYETIVLPSFRDVFSARKSVQATVTLLEHLHIILEKTPRDDIRTEVLPMLYNAFESPIQVQSAALLAVTNVSEYLDEMAIKRIILPKTKMIYEKNQNDLKIVSNVLSCVERTLDRLDKSQIIDEVLPLLYEIRLSDPQITLRVVNIYRLMLSDKKYGLSVNLMATKVMPSLLPQTVNPSLNLEQFTILLEVLQDMLEQIDRNQRNKLKLDNLSLPSPERHRPLRHQYSSDNMHVPPFNIPNLRVEQRKTSSAEDMARKNSTGGMLGGWWFGGSPSSPDSNFLRVANAFPNRRLSDNTLMTPKIRVAPSCASSPGGTPGGGLPIRRHSSIGPQERRGSTVNLSPPTGAIGYSSVSREGSSLSVPSTYLARSMIGGSMPNTSSSVPFLLSSSMQSIRSRRPSAVFGGSQGSGLLQQLGSGMVRFTSSHQPTNGRAFSSSTVRKCPSLNITFS
ncbi:PREDICTED: SCY1-like protein 2 [Nicrophorus vespilloides]|uniref:SCY1-like protein 2 n=1 Tax=Nicrophorus vespilloides TaxID=110193 RepID=A0ABM1M106_NICVS|nr:PREDICTED: SCY1-like protein 2 [Nicrophorus vespilloides]